MNILLYLPLKTNNFTQTIYTRFTVLVGTNFYLRTWSNTGSWCQRVLQSWITNLALSTQPY